MSPTPQRTEGSGWLSPGNVALIPAGQKFRPDVWEKVKNHLAPALKLGSGSVTLDDIMSLHREDKMQIWILQSPAEEVAAVLVTEVLTYLNEEKSMRMIVGGGIGSMAEGFNVLLDAVEEGAREAGCRSIIVEGRKGWERVLLDYQFRAIVLEKELN